MKSMFKIIFISIILGFQVNTTFAGSCCGGGSSSSLILVGDNIQEYSLGLTYRNDLGQTDNEGWATFHNNQIVDNQMSLNFQFQRQIYDHFQLAIKSSLIQKDIEKQNRHEQTMGLADIDLQSTYEYLPEYTYSPWKPRGFIYLKLSIPTSNSLYDSNSPIYSDVRGSGLYSISSGTFFIKHLSAVTLKSAIEWQHFLGRNFDQTYIKDYDKLIIPLGLSYGFDPLPIALGTGATWNYQTLKKFSGLVQGSASSEYFWEISAFANWIISREVTIGLSYSDSTLVGKSINSPLYRSLGFTYTNATAF